MTRFPVTERSKVGRLHERGSHMPLPDALAALVRSGKLRNQSPAFVSQSWNSRTGRDCSARGRHTNQ